VSTVVDKVKGWVSGGPDLVEEEDYGGPELTIVEHLVELRQRLTKIAVALVIGTIIGLVFSPQIFDLLKNPAPPDIKLIYIEMTEMFTTYFKVAFMTGIVLSSPVFLFQVIQFVGPGLTRRERRYVFTFLPIATFFFLSGMAFAYFVVLPFATRYLLSFQIDATPQIRIGNYIGFVTTFMLWIGAAFETPLIIFLLAKVNLVTVQRLAKYRKFAILAVFIIAAAITPTPDPFNQTLVAIPLYLLYELGVLFARFA
jgi:sec-independent protein translocase protein TatC